MSRPAKTGEFFLTRLEEIRDVQEVRKQTPRGKKRISSRCTFFYKRVFPILCGACVCITAWFVIDDIVIGQRMLRGSITPFLLTAVAFIGCVIYRLTKRTYADVVDEVWDTDDSLVVKKNGHEQRIALADCVKLRYDSFGLHHRITLVLNDVSNSGTEISFFAPFNIFSLYAESEFSGTSTTSRPGLFDDLSSRIEALRISTENRHTTSSYLTESNSRIGEPPKTQMFFRPLLENIRNIWRKKLSTFRNRNDGDRRSPKPNQE